MGAVLADAAVLDDGDAVGLAHGGEAVGDQDRDAPAGVLAEVGEELGFRAGMAYETALGGWYRGKATRPAV